MRTILLPLIAIAFTACTTETECECPETGEPECDTDTNKDTGDTEVIDTNEDTGDTDTAEDFETTLLISFTSEWSEVIEIEPGQTDINLGAVTFGSVDGHEITVDEVNSQLHIDSDGDLNFTAGMENEIYVEDYLENCRLVETDGVTEVMGPVEPLTYGEIFMSDDFVVGGDEPAERTFIMMCDVSEEAEQLEETTSFAWNLITASNSVASTADNMELNNVNGGFDPNEWDIWATIQNCSYEVNTWNGVVEMENEFAAALSGQAPYGYMDAEYEAEVMRVNMSALHECGGALTVEGFTMYITTSDEGETYWYEGIQIELVDMDTEESLGFGEVFITTLNGGGGSQNGAVMRMGEGGYNGIEIEAGDTRTIGFFIDARLMTSGDIFRLELATNQMALSDTNGSHTILFGTISGNTLQVN